VGGKTDGGCCGHSRSCLAESGVDTMSLKHLVHLSNSLRAEGTESPLYASGALEIAPRYA